MPQSSKYTDVDDNRDSVAFQKSPQWIGLQDSRADHGVAHRPLAIGATVTFNFVGECLYSYWRGVSGRGENTPFEGAHLGTDGDPYVTFCSKRDLPVGGYKLRATSGENFKLVTLDVFRVFGPNTTESSTLSPPTSSYPSSSFSSTPSGTTAISSPNPPVVSVSPTSSTTLPTAPGYSSLGPNPSSSAVSSQTSPGAESSPIVTSPSSNMSTEVVDTTTSLRPALPTAAESVATAARPTNTGALAGGTVGGLLLLLLVILLVTCRRRRLQNWSRPNLPSCFVLLDSISSSDSTGPTLTNRRISGTSQSTACLSLPPSYRSNTASSLAVAGSPVSTIPADRQSMSPKSHETPVHPALPSNPSSTPDPHPTMTQVLIPHAEVAQLGWYAHPELHAQGHSLLHILSSREAGASTPVRDVDSGLRLHEEAMLPPAYSQD
ncbi:hypothetical protein C8Q76DRAFT_699130 [Earliella scabrosa]|nr:hypothetical protein C8Q76DRAFT_699130 [Earliella scabrosa]